MIAATKRGSTVLEEFSYDPWGRRRNPNNWNNYEVTEPTLFTRGFTGHEHIGGYGFINMNGRVYDPRLGRFLSPDPYVQAPDFSQSFNRYSYVWNNPLKYTDPDGEWVSLALFLAGSYFLGAVYWGLQPDGSFNWKKANQGGLAAMAMAGTMVASAALPGLIPAWPGAIPGLMLAGGQFGSTAINTGAWNWMSTGSFTPNWRAASFSAMPGLIMAGIGGVNAMRNGGNFFTGKGITSDVYDIETTDNSIRTGGVDYSQEYADNKSRKWFRAHKRHENKLYADGTIPPGYRKEGDIVFNREGVEVAGTARYAGFGKTDIYLYKAAFRSKKVLFFAMGHEYLHAEYFALGLTHVSDFRTHHASIHRWEYHQAAEWNWRVDFFRGRYLNSSEFYNPRYHYNTVGFYVRLLGSWP